MERDSSGSETSTHDLLLYIFTGVFMLFVLDTFVHIGKRSKNKLTHGDQCLTLYGQL